MNGVLLVLLWFMADLIANTRAAIRAPERATIRVSLDGVLILALYVPAHALVHAPLWDCVAALLLVHVGLITLRADDDDDDSDLELDPREG